ncbi:MAG: 1,4-dihydroxy-6-naphthoate synthase [Bacteroidales bacterium]
MKITLGFSTCPNDTYLFDALVNHKIDTGGLQFEPVLADVEQLNLMALEGRLDVTKLSYHAWLRVWKDYQVLDSGSALGRGNGPLLVSRLPIEETRFDTLVFAVPGEYTTANLLLQLAYPSVRHRRVMLFSRIGEAILSGEVDAGVLIHETRFTYQADGLMLVRDLGRYWEEATGEAIPLGGILAHRRLSMDKRLLINRLIRSSLEFANANPTGTISFMKQYAQLLDEGVLQAHLRTFVNDFTLDLGPAGRKAILRLAEVARQTGLIPERPKEIFLTGE